MTRGILETARLIGYTLALLLFIAVSFVILVSA